MQNSRRMQRLVEAKITWSIATGKLPHIVKPEAPKPVIVKLGPNVPQPENGAGSPSEIQPEQA